MNDEDLKNQPELELVLTEPTPTNHQKIMALYVKINRKLDELIELRKKAS